MFSLNRAQLIGYQTQPVTLRKTPSGTSVTDLNLIVPVSVPTEAGVPLDLRGFFVVTLWGPMAEVAERFVRPGAQVFVSGRLQTDAWEDQKTGEKRSKTKVVAVDMILLDPKDGQMQTPDGAKLLTGVLNRADVIGHVTRDPEIRTTTSGQQVLTLGVATNDRWKDRVTGEDRERTEFHSVVIWGQLAADVGRLVKKGQRVHACGRVQTRSWEARDGSKRTTTEIIAENVSLLGIRNKVAEAAVRLESPVAKQVEPGPLPETEVPVEVPDIAYTPTIKAEDLPF